MACRPTTFYHGTSPEAALSIQTNGFDPERSGSNAGALLGKGVYCTTTLEKAMHYAKRKAAQGIIFELRIDLGRCKTLQKDDPMMKSWQEHGYDSAWAPDGANTSGLEENCIKDSARIRIVRAIAGHTGKLLELGMTINDSGRLVMLADLQASSGDPATVLKKGDCKVCGKPVWSNEGRVKLPDDGFYVHQTCHNASQAAAPEPRDLWSTPPSFAICDVAECSRSTWNGQVNQQCCRTCKSSSGASHGPDCDKKHSQVCKHTHTSMCVCRMHGPL